MGESLKQHDTLLDAVDDKVWSPLAALNMAASQCRMQHESQRRALGVAGKWTQVRVHAGE